MVGVWCFRFDGNPDCHDYGMLPGAEKCKCESGYEFENGVVVSCKLLVVRIDVSLGLGLGLGLSLSLCLSLGLGLGLG